LNETLLRIEHDRSTIFATQFAKTPPFAVSACAVIRGSVS
jgi:hypothetical protein